MKAKQKTIVQIPSTVHTSNLNFYLKANKLLKLLFPKQAQFFFSWLIITEEFSQVYRWWEREVQLEHYFLVEN